MNYRKHSNEFKDEVVRAYLAGARASDLIAKYELNKTQIFSWSKKWREHSCFPDGRGKSKTVRPKVTKVNKEEMTKDEYIAYLEMELDILKYIAFLERKKQK